MWVNRLPSEYRRRLYTNLAVVAGLVIFFVIAMRLRPHYGPLAILSLFGLLLVFLCVWPFVCLAKAQPRPKRSAFIFCGSWVGAFAYVAASILLPSLPAAGLVMLLGVILMSSFLITYRRIVFPDLFGGKIRERWKTVQAAQRADKEDMNKLIASIRHTDER